MSDKDVYTEFASKLIQDNIHNVLKGIATFGKQKYDSLLISSRLAFKKYYATAINKYYEMKTILYRDKPVRLYDFYVDLEIKQGNSLICTHDIEEILRISESVILTGIAGCGKSTLMKHLFLNTIKKQKYIPIFLEMKNINDYKEDFENFVYQSLAYLNFDLEKEIFFKSLASDNYIIFLDGFDEIRPDKYTQVTKEVIRFSSKYFKNKYIVSSRHDENFSSWNSFTEYEVLPLTKDKIIELIEKIDYDIVIKNSFLDSIRKDLYDKYTSFLSNPLLATIMLMTFSECAEIPNKMHLFFSQAFDCLFLKHDATKEGYKRNKYTTLAIDDFKSVFASFCMQTYLSSEISFTKETLIENLEKAKSISGIDFIPEDFFNDLCKCLCIIIQDGFRYTFTHRTFQEYFAALFFVRSSNDVKIKLLNNLEFRFSRDRVFSLIFEMNRYYLEDFYLIPKCKEMIDDYKSIKKESKSFAYFILIKSFDSFGVNLSQMSLYFTTRSKDKMDKVKYFDIFRFILFHYRSIYKYELPFIQKNDFAGHVRKIYMRNKKILKKYCTIEKRHITGADEKIIEIDFTDISKNQKLRNILFDFRPTLEKESESFFYVYDQINENKRHRADSIDLLFSKNSPPNKSLKLTH